MKKYLIMNRNRQCLTTLDFKSEFDFKIKRKWTSFDEIDQCVIVPYAKTNDAMKILGEYGMRHITEYFFLEIK